MGGRVGGTGPHHLPSHPPPPPTPDSVRNTSAAGTTPGGLGRGWQSRAGGLCGPQCVPPLLSLLTPPPPKKQRKGTVRTGQTPEGAEPAPGLSRRLPFLAMVPHFTPPTPHLPPPQGKAPFRGLPPQVLHTHTHTPPNSNSPHGDPHPSPGKQRRSFKLKTRPPHTHALGWDWGPPKVTAEPPPSTRRAGPSLAQAGLDP